MATAAKPTRRRLHSVSDDLELAVPLAVEIWNLVVPPVVAEETTASLNEGKDSADEKDRAATQQKGRYYQLRQHHSSILERVELQIVVQEEEAVAAAEEDVGPTTTNDSLASPPDDSDEDARLRASECEAADDGEEDDAVETQPDDLEKVETKKKQVVLFRGSNDNGLTVHPGWYHLQEKLGDNEGWINLHRDTYETLELQFCVQRRGTDDADCDSSFCFLKIPAHPSLLTSLGDGNNMQRVGSKSSLTSSSSSVNGSGNNSSALLLSCAALPVNTLAVHFSDGTMRILPHHYNLLARQNPDIFRTRAEVVASHHHYHHQRSQSSLVRRGPKTSASGSVNNTRRQGSGAESSTRGSSFEGDNELESAVDEPRFCDDVFRVLDKGDGSRTEASPSIGSPARKEGGGSKTDHGVSGTSEQALVEARDDVLAQSLQEERERLLLLIQQEEEALEQETQELLQMQTYIRENLKPQCEQLREQTLQVQEATASEKEELEKLAILLEVHRVRLVKGLETCFPVLDPPPPPAPSTASTVSSYLVGSSSSSNGGSLGAASAAPSPTLRDWKLPATGQLFSSSLLGHTVGGCTADEELSAVLGALAQVVLLLAKYLGVPLRYRIFSNSSRSAIQDDRGILHPLFLARPVERQQVEQGLVLLERNVTCIARARGVLTTTTPSESEEQQNEHIADHVFEKIRQIYQATAQGFTADATALASRSGVV